MRIPQPSPRGGCPSPHGSGSRRVSPGAGGTRRAAWEGIKRVSRATQGASVAWNKPSYTAKKPLPKTLLLLRNSTQSRLSVDVRGSGTRSPQNLPGKWRRWVRPWAHGKKKLLTGREEAAFLHMWLKASDNLSCGDSSCSACRNNSGTEA